MFDSAAKLDADPGWLIENRLPVVASVVFAGLRVHELGALRPFSEIRTFWGDLDLATRNTPGYAAIRALDAISAQQRRVAVRSDG